MRTIKFRGKTKGNEWVYGYYVYTYPNEHRIFGKDRTSIEVIPETVSQSTGLLDKDGKEIYEGDIVKDIDDELHQIKWLHSGWGLQRLSDGERWGWCIVPGYNKEREFLEVIGNIFDNPELLKKEEK